MSIPEPPRLAILQAIAANGDDAPNPARWCWTDLIAQRIGATVEQTRAWLEQMDAEDLVYPTSEYVTNYWGITDKARPLFTANATLITRLCAAPDCASTAEFHFYPDYVDTCEAHVGYMLCKRLTYVYYIPPPNRVFFQEEPTR